jgi:pyruvate dehydrogenase E1 component
MQELEGIFRGAGWNVIKVVWGHQWDDLLAKDTSGLLKQRMNEVCDGEMQNYKANGGAYTREHFFGKYPETLELVKHLSDDEIGMLARGGHDPQKVYAAYDSAVKCTDQPTVILAQTVKGYGFGDQGQAQNETHQLKKLDQDNLKRFRDLFNIPVADEDLADLPYYRPAEDSPELAYMRARRDALGGPIPSRRDDFDALEIPELDKFKAQLKSTGEREISTTMAFVRQLSTLAKDKKIGERIVPIVPDEARTFGMEGMFRQLGIYSPVGQRYTPHDSDQMMFYKESDKGQILEEGINEAGATASWLAAATSYSAHNYAMIPFYIYYSMFGFQRVMDLIWAAGDSQARGFLLGATAGRTTLNGEGLQHQDGHSHLMANMVPNCVSYDPTYSYEVAVIVQDGINKMYGEEKKNVFYYLTLMNENYQHPEKPEGCEEGIIAGMYKLRAADPKAKLRVQLMGSGTILREVEAAVELLANYGVDADVWSVTSANELTREAQDCDRWNLMHPTEEARVPYITEKLDAEGTPVIASTDYMRAYMHQLCPYVNQPYRVLGTDGYGRSDSRRKLREFFEVDRNYVTLAALKSLADAGSIKATVVAKAIEDLGINPEKLNPLYC